MALKSFNNSSFNLRIRNQFIRINLINDAIDRIEQFFQITIRILNEFTDIIPVNGFLILSDISRKCNTINCDFTIEDLFPEVTNLIRPIIRCNKIQTLDTLTNGTNIFVNLVDLTLHITKLSELLIISLTSCFFSIGKIILVIIAIVMYRHMIHHPFQFFSLSVGQFTELDCYRRLAPHLSTPYFFFSFNPLNLFGIRGQNFRVGTQVKYQGIHFFHYSQLLFDSTVCFYLLI